MLSAEIQRTHTKIYAAAEKISHLAENFIKKVFKNVDHSTICSHDIFDKRLLESYELMSRSRQT